MTNADPQAIYKIMAAYGLKLVEESRSDSVRLLQDIWQACYHGLRMGPVRAAKSYQALRRLRRTPVFDRAFYRLQLEDARAGTDLVAHYVFHGVEAGLDPAPGFSTRFYLEAHPDVKALGVNPLLHYLKYGGRESRRVEPSERIDIMGALMPDSLALNMPDGPLDATMALAFGVSEAPEEAADHEWPLRDRGASAAERADFGLYDIRPHDPVLDVAREGQAFMDRFGLNGAEPQWQGAVNALNDLKFPANKSACDVSVIIPVYGQLAYTLNCLQALLRHASRYSFEILIGDDASPDESHVWLPEITGVTVVRHAQNGGFIETCNRTAEKARGRYVVMLNNDTRVCPGWLDALIDTFTLFPKAGLAGSMLLYSDGSLQEAGGIVWRDGSAWNYGRNDDPNRPRYSYARHADYVSGAAIALPRALWEKLGGFDEIYKPAYYEDTDLAFRIRESGFDVIMQPLSRVIHYEGKTSGTDTSQGVKSYQKANKLVFYKRWAATLERHRAEGDRPWLECNREAQKRVLIVDAVNPTPGEDAGSLATLNLIRAYQALGYQVTFVPEDNFLYQTAPVSRLQAMGVECLYAPFELSMSAILRRQGYLYDVVQLIRPGVAHKTLDLVKRLAPRARILYLNADLHYLRMQRQAEIDNSPALLNAAREMKEIELDLTRRCEVTLVHSVYERNLLKMAVPASRVSILPLIEAVVPGKQPHKARRDIMFLGGYRHTPNMDAAEWLIDDIWPQLAAQLPEARLLLVGANPPASLLNRATDRIVVSGTVPDLAPWFATTRVFVAPLRYGAGAKGKILAALGHGVPVVGTDVASEGMALEAGKTIFTANSSEEFVRETIKLYREPATAWRRRSKLAQAHVSTYHSLQNDIEAIRAALE